MKIKQLFFIVTLIVSTFTMAQNNSFTKNEKLSEVDSLYRISQPTKALEELDKVVARAKKENDLPTIVEGYSFYGAMLRPLEQEEKAELFLRLISEVEELKEPAQSLVRLELTQNFVYQFNKWFGWHYLEVYDSINFLNVEKKFEFAYNQMQLLEQQLPSLKEYEYDSLRTPYLLTKDKLFLHKTLADLVAYRLIEFYKSDVIRRGSTLKHTSTDEKAWYETPDKFTQLTFSKDNLTTKVLRLFQHIETDKESPDFLSVATYQRVKFLESEFSKEGKLNDVWQSQFDYFKNSSARSKFLYEIAKQKFTEGQTYHFKTKPEVESLIKEAHDLITKELKQFPVGDFIAELENLQRAIEEPSITLQLPTVSASKKAIPLQISHGNYEEYYVRVYYVKDYDPLRAKTLQKYAELGELEKVQELKIELTNKGLFQKRTTELLLNGLDKPGRYFVVGSSHNKKLEEFAKDNDRWRELKLTQGHFTVTDIMLANSRINGVQTVLVTDFESGHPIAGAEVEAYYFDYNLGNKPQLLTKGTTDKEGLYQLKNSPKLRYNRIHVIVRHKGSVLSSSDYQGSEYQEEKTTTIELFTDRSIYRPGQIVYFKGIAFEGLKNDFKTVSNAKVTIEIRDANYQSVFKETYRTNSYGSMDGSFVLPSAGPLGNYRIEATIEGAREDYRGANNFSVEEYKRPTYEVKLFQPEKEAKLDSDVEITGNVKAFAGYPIADAEVTYSVYRNWSRFWRFSGAGGGDKIKEGSLKTDQDGDFTIDFFAETDPDAVAFAYYYYTVRVKVTDLSGETHEETISLNLSKTGLSLQVEMPNELFAHDDAVVIPTVVNLAGKAQEGYSGTLEVYKRKSANDFLGRIWNNTEISHLTEKDLKAIYPRMRWDSDEDIYEEQLIKTVKFTAGDTISMNSLLGKDQGLFVFKFSSKTKDGETIEHERELTIIDVKSKKMPSNEALWTFVSSPRVEVGKSVDFQVGSSFKNAKAYLLVFSDKELIHQEWVDLKERHSFCYSAKEKDRGVLTYYVVLVNNGQIYTRSEEVFVPYSNKYLEIEASTFRDKLQPEDKEEWSFTIKDKDGKLIKSELAASMYDASLDQFRSHYWYLSPYNSYRMNMYWGQQWSRSTGTMGNTYGLLRNSLINPLHKYLVGGDEVRVVTYAMPLIARDGAAAGGTITREEIAYLPTRSAKGVASTVGDMEEVRNEADSLEEKVTEEMDLETPAETINPRENFNETAFFYPMIYADSKGDYVLNFTLPESLTKWNLMMLAHTKDLKIGRYINSVEAKKDLMITANAPRFVRQGDKFDFVAKLINLTDEDQEMEARLELVNPVNSESLSWILDELVKTVNVPANSSVDVAWRLQVGNEELVQYTVSARNEKFSDGERNVLPILSNRSLVTQTDHILIKDKGTKTHTFEAFVNNDSETLENKSFTVEYIDNLAWQAVLALPNIAKKNDQSVTALVNAYYANAIAKYIVDQHPKIKQIFDQWKLLTPDVFLSELEKNEELKNIVLAETPWVLDAKTESEQRRRIALLFEINQLQNNQSQIVKELKERQNADGGFAWFEGGKSNEFITQNILTRLGHLNRLGVPTNDLDAMVKQAEKFVAMEQVRRYEEFVRRHGTKKEYSVSSYDVNWLYSRTFFASYQSEKVTELTELYQAKLKKEWTRFNPYMQALIGLYFTKEGVEREAELIYASLLDRAKKNTHLGMYWAENSGWYWYENKISTQAMIISFFQERKASDAILDDARLWLILNKESSSWRTGIETADAIYAVLLSGRDYLSNTEPAKVKVGKQTIVYKESTSKEEVSVDLVPGLNQFQYTWTNDEVKKELGTVTVEKTSEGPGVLNMYWQFTEELSKIEGSQNSSMKIQKKYYRIVPGDKAEIGEETNNFNVGDKIEVELIVTVDRDMEFVHLKDLRPAGFEPALTRSGYRWDKGAFYYQSPKDASMEFFIDHLSKGTYKFTYTVYATHSGEFNSGMATVQSYYAPKFAGHTGTVEVEVVR